MNRLASTNFQIDELYLELQRDSRLQTFKEFNNPFPGLRPFKTSEYPLFFGRRNLTKHLTQKINDSRFLPILGSSGTGKSSLVRAGLLPTLYDQQFKIDRRDWKVAIFRPGMNPIDNLAYSLAYAITECDTDDPLDDKIVHNYNELSSGLRKDSFSVEKLLIDYKRRNPNCKILIIADQFEEVFRFQEDSLISQSDESNQFVDQLIELSSLESLSHCHVIMTMRSEFLGRCVKFKGLPEKINDSLFLVPNLDLSQIREAILKPPKVLGARIDDRLIDKVLEEIVEQKDQLPVLQHAMSRTFEVWRNDEQRKNTVIQIKHFVHPKVKGLDNAINVHASELMSTLRSEEKAIASIVFKQITSRTADSDGVRRPRSLDEILAVFGIKENEPVEAFKPKEVQIVKVIDRFRSDKVAFLRPTSESPLKRQSVIDISHESLIRIWKNLNIWIDEETTDAQLYDDLQNARIKESKEGLLKRPKLSILHNWWKFNQPSSAWASRYHKDNERTHLAKSLSKEPWESIDYQDKLYLLKDADNRLLALNETYLRKSKKRGDLDFLIRIFGIPFVILAALSFALINQYNLVQQEKKQRLLEKEWADRDKQLLEDLRAASDTANLYVQTDSILRIREGELNSARIDLEVEITRNQQLLNDLKTNRSINVRQLAGIRDTIALRDDSIRFLNRNMNQLRGRIFYQDTIIENQRDRIVSLTSSLDMISEDARNEKLELTDSLNLILASSSEKLKVLNDSINRYKSIQDGLDRQIEQLHDSINVLSGQNTLINTWIVDTKAVGIIYMGYRNISGFLDGQILPTSDSKAYRIQDFNGEKISKIDNWEIGASYNLRAVNGRENIIINELKDGKVSPALVIEDKEREIKLLAIIERKRKVKKQYDIYILVEIER